MIGMLINEMEQKEVEYLIKRELDELLFEFHDDKLEGIIKRAMEERYKILFSLFVKVASPDACMKYMRKRRYK